MIASQSKQVIVFLTPVIILGYIRFMYIIMCIEEDLVTS